MNSYEWEKTFQGFANTVVIMKFCVFDLYFVIKVIVPWMTFPHVKPVGDVPYNGELQIICHKPKCDVWMLTLQWTIEYVVNSIDRKYRILRFMNRIMNLQLSLFFLKDYVGLTQRSPCFNQFCKHRKEELWH